MGEFGYRCGRLSEGVGAADGGSTTGASGSAASPAATVGCGEATGTGERVEASPPAGGDVLRIDATSTEALISRTARPATGIVVCRLASQPRTPVVVLRSLVAADWAAPPVRANRNRWGPPLRA